MKTASSALRTGSLLLAIAGFGGLGVFQGCAISFEEVDCTECDASSLCHNHLGADNMCYCDAGYTDVTPNDEDLSCESVDTRLGGSQCVHPNSHPQGNFCYCDPGFAWCSDNRDDFTCCADPSQDSLSGTTWTDPSTTTSDDSTTTGSSTTDTTSTTTTMGETTEPTTTTEGTTALPPDPSECDVDGKVACSNADPENVQGSVYWTCQSGAWVESPEAPIAQCQFDGYDFSYGCYTDYESQTVEFLCGDGPGTPCTLDDELCIDADVFHYCVQGRLTEISCAAYCADPENGLGYTYSYGECFEEGTTLGCDCCDEIDEDGHCVFPEGT